MDRLYKSLESVGLLDKLEDYNIYVSSRYGVADMEMLTKEMLLEQLTLPEPTTKCCMTTGTLLLRIAMQGGAAIELNFFSSLLLFL